MLKVPSFSQSKPKLYEIPAPGRGGLNLEDLDYTLTSNQSPNMLNMMYKNGAFGKRHGQKYITENLPSEILKVGYYEGKVVMHAGTKLYTFENGMIAEIYNGLSTTSGVFINFNKNLYYLNGAFIEYNGTTCKAVDPYIPEVHINRKPDGSYGDVIEPYNRLGSAFKNTFNGDGTSTVYHLTDKNLDAGSKVTCEVDLKEVTNFTVNYTDGTVTFNTAPTKGQNNVVITAHKTEQEYIDSILNCRLAANYGGNNNSRIFLAGGGNSNVFFSYVFDATYWPETNHLTLGNAETDVTGFGEQNDALMVFKSDSMYRIDYYLNDDGTADFTTYIINPKIGCTASNSIQLINNRLTWFSDIYGVCTLVSTLLENEKNVQVISRNINGGLRANGLMQEKDLSKIQTANWDGQYWLAVNGHVYMWDYTITPYSDTGKPDYDASKLAWYMFDNFDVTQFVNYNTELYYARGKRLVKLTEDFNDFGNPIAAKYQTPLSQFGAEIYLKNVIDLFVQCRADTASVIDIKYVTEGAPEIEDESIVIGARLWEQFSYGTFAWLVINYGHMFRRKCNLKKVQMAGVLFENKELDRDMSLSYLGFTYSLVKKAS